MQELEYRRRPVVADEPERSYQKKLVPLDNGAQKSVTRQEQGGAGAREADMMETSGFSLSSKLHDLKSTRSLCSAIVESGATLHHLLQQETQNREDINKALRHFASIYRFTRSRSIFFHRDRSASRFGLGDTCYLRFS